MYAGATTDLVRRMRAHRRGVAAKYTRARLPIVLVAWWHPESYDQARSHEARFKRLTRPKKNALLETNEAFGCRLHKAPQLPPTPTLEERTTMPTPPQSDELPGYRERARTSQVRIATGRGDIVVRLFPDDAPVHAAAFLKLVEAGFYDGLVFHRVEPGFVVQGGDPTGNGTGGPGYTLKAEFNERPHERGTLAMARASNPDSAGSQFYLCLADARFLDGQYTVFGKMTEGFDALDAIRPGDAMKKLSIESIAPSD
ncbi:MAG: peptidylprolyl isomerase [Candidatus Eremiobacteraeota bacterium]|nr:peptidylprolyl isomerase [Candidatus Eremiobacteraeota bacterium]